MTAPDVAADAAELREIIAGLRLEAADLADKLSQMARSVASMDAIMNVAIAARDEGYREGRGERHLPGHRPRSAAPRRAPGHSRPHGRPQGQDRRCPVNDHYHYEYAEARHDHRGEYASDDHDHHYDYDYAEKHHRHYDDERAVEDLRGQIRELRAIMIEFGLDLSEAQGRINALEAQTPEARQAELEADIAMADAAESGYDEEREP